MFVIQIRSRSPTNQETVREIQRRNAVTRSRQTQYSAADRPLSEAEAEAAARTVDDDYRRLRQAVVRSSASATAPGGGATAAATTTPGGAARSPATTNNGMTSIAQATSAVPRVFQLDGERVDAEINKLIFSQFNGAFELLNAPVVFRYTDELKLLLAAVVYRFSVWSHSQCFGDKLMNLVYRDERAAARAGRSLVMLALPETVPSRGLKLLHAILTLLLPYLFRKWERHIVEFDWHSPPPPGVDGSPAAANQDSATDDGEHPSPLGRLFNLVPLECRPRVAKLVQTAGAVAAWMDMINFVSFLAGGAYRSVADRVLGMRLVHGHQRMARHVSLYYMNQGYFWQVLLGFASVVLPLLRLNRLWARLASFRLPWGNQRGGGAGETGPSADGADHPNHCAYCGVAASNAVMPRTLRPCGHLSCYFCFASRKKQRAAEDVQLSCPLCDRMVTHAEFCRR